MTATTGNPAPPVVTGKAGVGPIGPPPPKPVPPVPGPKPKPKLVLTAAQQKRWDEWVASLSHLLPADRERVIREREERGDVPAGP